MHPKDLLFVMSAIHLWKAKPSKSYLYYTVYLNSKVKVSLKKKVSFVVYSRFFVKVVSFQNQSKLKWSVFSQSVFPPKVPPASKFSPPHLSGEPRVLTWSLSRTPLLQSLWNLKCTWSSGRTLLFSLFCGKLWGFILITEILLEGLRQLIFPSLLLNNWSGQSW